MQVLLKAIDHHLYYSRKKLTEPPLFIPYFLRCQKDENKLGFVLTIEKRFGMTLTR